MLRAVKHQFIFVFIIIAISPCPTYSKRVINVQGVTCVTNVSKNETLRAPTGVHFKR
jgi:hypothetical protein